MWIVNLNYRKPLPTQTGDKEVMEDYSVLFGAFEKESYAIEWAKGYGDKPGLIGYDIWFVNKL